MQLKYKVQITVIILSILVGSTSAYMSYTTNRNLINQVKTDVLKDTVALIQKDFNDQAKKAAARASMIAYLPSIQEAFRAQDSIRMMATLGSVMKEQRDKYGVREAQFLLPPAISFLRVYAPNDGHGEDLSKIRDMVVYTYQKQQSQSGLEIGRRGLSIRGMEVVKDEQGPIGVFEIGMSTTPILENLKKNTGFDGGVFVDEKLMSTIATLLPSPDSDRIMYGFRNVDATDWQIIRKIVPDDISNRIKDVSFNSFIKDETEYATVIVPILDYKGSNIGFIMGIRNFEEYQNQLQTVIVQSIWSGFLQSIILMMVLLIMLKSMSNNLISDNK